MVEQNKTTIFNGPLFQKLKQILRVPKVEVPQAEVKVAAKNAAAKAKAVHQFSPDEINVMEQLPKQSDGKPAVDIGKIFAGLLETSKTTADQIKTNKAMVELTPEIIKAKQIYVSSILSPNDMQTGSVTISSNSKSLTSDQNAAVSEALTDFFNKELDFGSNLADWLNETIFDNGCKAIMILPNGNLDALVQGEQRLEAKASTESMFATIDARVVDEEDWRDEAYAAIEALPSFNNDKISADQITRSLDGATKSINGVIKNTTTSNMPLISTKFSKIASGKLKTISDLNKKKKDLSDNLIKSNFGNIFLVSEYDKFEEGNKAIVVELPPQAVVPVCLPGSPKEHLGYFVLVDRWGNPMNFEPSQMTATALNQHTVVNRAFQTMVPDYAGVWGKIEAERKWETVTAVFHVAVGQMMKNKLKEVGLVNSSISQTNVVSNCILYNMLRKRQVQLIFVPEPMMIYYRFDHREDGTGKSVLESVKSVLSLRSTLFVAKIMGAVNNAVNHKTITLDVDEKNRNIEQTLDLIRNAYAAKHMLNTNNLNPAAISQDIAKSSISVIPRNLAGLSGNLEVTTASESNNKANVDDGIIELLTDMTISGIGVPHSALNALSETEFAKSVVTGNLIFANDVRNKQWRLRKPNRKFVQNYIQMSGAVQDLIKEKLKSDKSEGIQLTNELMLDIIRSVEVDLPTPNLAANKAQFDEISAFINALKDVLEATFSEDLVMIDDPAIKTMLVGLRARVNSELIRKFLSTLGVSVFDIPELKNLVDTDMTEMMDMHQMMLNLKKAYESRKAILDDAAGKAPEGTENPTF